MHINKIWVLGAYTNVTLHANGREEELTLLHGSTLDIYETEEGAFCIVKDDNGNLVNRANEQRKPADKVSAPPSLDDIGRAVNVRAYMIGMRVAWQLYADDGEEEPFSVESVDAIERLIDYAKRSNC